MSFNHVLKAMALGAVVAPVMMAQGRAGGGGGAAAVISKTAPEMVYRSMLSGAGNAGARLGLTTTSSSTVRDTVGLLVSSIVAGGPAEGVTSAGLISEVDCEVDVPLPEKVTYKCGVKMYEESSDTVFASDCGFAAALASIAL